MPSEGCTGYISRTDRTPPRVTGLPACRARPRSKDALKLRKLYEFETVECGELEYGKRGADHTLKLTEAVGLGRQERGNFVRPRGKIPAVPPGMRGRKPANLVRVARHAGVGEASWSCSGAQVARFWEACASRVPLSGPRLV